MKINFGRLCTKVSFKLSKAMPLCNKFNSRTAGATSMPSVSMAMHRGFPQTFQEVIHGQKTGCFENKNHIV